MACAPNHLFAGGGGGGGGGGGARGTTDSIALINTFVILKFLVVC